MPPLYLLSAQSEYRRDGKTLYGAKTYYSFDSFRELQMQVSVLTDRKVHLRASPNQLLVKMSPERILHLEITQE